MRLREIRNKLQDATCLIVGDIMLDLYIYGEVGRISPEAPVPVVRVVRESVSLGGAGNVAANIVGLGVQTMLSGILGDDYDGGRVMSILKEHNILFEGIQSPKRNTTVKTRIIGRNQQVVRYDREDVDSIAYEDEVSLLQQIEEQIGRCNMVVLSDYKKGVCSQRVSNAVIQGAIKRGLPVLVDPKEMNWEKYHGATILTPNFKELSEAYEFYSAGDAANISLQKDSSASGKSVIKLINTEDSVREAARALMKRYDIANVLVTRSEYGMTLVTADDCCTFKAIARSVYDVSGAGDTVVATLAALLAAGVNLKDAVDISNFAAGISVSHAGTYTVSYDEVETAYDEAHDITDSKIMNISELQKKLEKWRKLEKKVVFTNGCFDILHAGHVTYLQKAAAMGDVMIIGLNSDASTRRLKGDGRPVNSEYDRAKVLSALAITDAVVIFEEDTPYELIKVVKPDVLVKGGDYVPENIVGREFAKEVRVVDFLPGHSTSGIIEKIQESQ